jgi:hypothetical protein
MAPALPDTSLVLFLEPDFGIPSRRSNNRAEKTFHLLSPSLSRMKAAAYGFASAQTPESTLVNVRD